MSTILKVALFILIPLVLAVGIFVVIDTQNGGNVVDSVLGLFPTDDDPINGNGSNGADFNGDTTNGSDPSDDDPSPLISKQIARGPVVGYVLKNNSIRYMEKEKGNIYDYSISSNNSERISNKTITKVGDVLWGAEGNEFITKSVVDNSPVYTYYSFGVIESAHVFLKDLKPGDTDSDVLELQKFLNSDPETLVAVSGIGSPSQETNYYGQSTRAAVVKFQNKHSIEGEDGELGEMTRNKINSLTDNNSSTDPGFEPQTDLSSKDISRDVSFVIPSPNKNRIFTAKKSGDFTVGSISSMAGSGVSNVFKSVFRDFNYTWPKEDTIIMTTKPSSKVPGFSYELNIEEGSYKKIVGDVEGLTMLSNTNVSNVIYSTNSPVGNGFVTFALNPEDNTKKALSINTLPAYKCVWSKMDSNIVYCAVPKNIPFGAYPDDWLKGKVSFSDALWEIDVSENTQKVIFDPLQETITTQIDVVSLGLNENEDRLIFINKKDLSLWSLRLR